MRRKPQFFYLYKTKNYNCHIAAILICQKEVYASLMKFEKKEGTGYGVFEDIVEYW